MILERLYVMPYAYTVRAEIQRKKSVAVKDYVTTGHVEQIVREVSLSDAPVVMSWIVGSGLNAFSHEIRSFDGSLYIAALAAHEGFATKNPYAPFSKADLPDMKGVRTERFRKLTMLMQARMKDWIDHDECAALESIFRKGYFIPSVDKAQIKSQISSNQADRRAGAKALLDDALVITRDLWIRVSEPRLVFRQVELAENGAYYTDIADIYFGRSEASETLVWGSPYSIETPAMTKFFAVTELEAFKAVCSKVGMVAEFNQLQIHDETVFTTDWEFNARVRTIDFAVRSLEPQVGLQPVTAIAAWSDARDALASFSETGDRSAIDDAVEYVMPTLLSSFEAMDERVRKQITASLADLRSADVQATVLRARTP
jgi:hypothetical protein